MKLKIIILLMLILCIIALAGCSGKFSEKNVISSNTSLPFHATVLKNHGNGWIEFSLDGNRYLFYSKRFGYAGYACVTQIIEE